MATGNQQQQIQGWALPQQGPQLPAGVTQRQLQDYQRGLTQNMTPALQGRIQSFLDANMSTVTPQVQQPVSTVQTNDTQFMPVVDQFNQIANQFQGTSPGIVNQMRALTNEYNDGMSAMDRVTGLYGAFEEGISPYYQQYMDINRNIGNSVVNQLLANRDRHLSQYGPQGEQRQRLDEYYRALGDYLSGASADELAMMEAQGVQSGASLGAQRAARNQAMRDQLERFTEAKQREVQDYDNLYKTLNDYEAQFVQAYADSNDRFIVDAYRNLVNYKNTIGQNLLNAQQELLVTQAALGGGGGGGGIGGGGGGGTGGTGGGEPGAGGDATGGTTPTGTGGTTSPTGTTPSGTASPDGGFIDPNAVRRLTDQERMNLTSPFIGDPSDIPATIIGDSSGTPAATPGIMSGGQTVMPSQLGTTYVAPTQSTLSAEAVRQPDPIREAERIGAANMSPAEPLRPTVLPTPRQIQDYERGLGGNMSANLIRSIQYYLANPDEYQVVWQASMTPQQVQQANAGAIQPLLQAGMNTGLIVPTTTTGSTAGPVRQAPFIQPLTGQQQMNLLSPRL